MFYLTKTPGLLKSMYPSCTWNFTRDQQVMYLTFDDGPHPVATPFVLDALKEFNAKGTFFCIGKNVKDYPAIYKRILNEGHTTGNHTFHHLNGWKTSDQDYIKNIGEARKYIDSNLFRPPYGRITKFQIRLLNASENVKQKTIFKIIMWDVLSGDFDMASSADKCVKNVISNAKEGSIVVFHDSEKALPRMQKSLIESLQYFSERGFKFDAVI
ncbi:MAG TPA: polysaccharide deacetylase family protein [Flavitalea sp.]|nr:polysaccharide deacetylase family protein [Flavitalea sp.]